MLIDTTHLSMQIASDVAAIVITHLYGRMVHMPAVMEIANRAGIPVIEDCAQAHGARISDRRSGSWGHAGCFSFYPTKNLGAIGDGGAVVTNDSGTAVRIRQLRQYGWDAKYCVQAGGGRNSRLDEMQAAILLEQLPFLDGWNERRQAIARRYSQDLGRSGFAVPDASGEDYVAHLYVVRTSDRERVRERLAGAGISTDVHYPVADHQQRGWKSAAWAEVRLPETEAACREVLTLPCFPELTDDEAGRVVEALLQKR
jgi:dTDP-4-amino-4,6-dideoxygalactose transaminase